MQEAAIEEYFKPIDKESQALMEMQLKGEEKTMIEMVKAMQQQALHEKLEAEKNAKGYHVDTNENDLDPASPAAPQEASMR